MRAVDKYANLLRASVATAGNEHRLGANEAPPAIVSIFLGDQLTDIFGQLAAGGAKSSRQGGELRLGISTLPPLPKDCTDRNRTSPFAFTGNKFEFRMVGSTQSTSGPTFVLNTIVADVLSEIADELEKSGDVNATAQEVLKKIATEHARIIFNGDNYCSDWVVEAEKRGLPNLVSTVEALNTIMDKEHVALFGRHHVLSETELKARTDILLEAYSMTINIEAKTMLSIAKRQILPAAARYSGRLGDSIGSVGAAGVSADTQKKMLEEICALMTDLSAGIENLEARVAESGAIEDCAGQAETFRNIVIPAMEKVREAADRLELIVDADLWPLPTYAEMLFVK